MPALLIKRYRTYIIFSDQLTRLLFQRLVTFISNVFKSQHALADNDYHIAGRWYHLVSFFIECICHEINHVNYKSNLLADWPTNYDQHIYTDIGLQLIKTRKMIEI